MAAVETAFERGRLWGYFISMRFEFPARHQMVISDPQLGKLLVLTLRKVQANLTELYFSDPYPPDFSCEEAIAFGDDEGFKADFDFAADHFSPSLVEALGKDDYIWLDDPTRKPSGKKPKRERGLNADTVEKLRTLVENREGDILTTGRARRRTIAYEEIPIDKKTVAKYLPDLVRRWRDNTYRKGEIEEIIRKLEGI